MSAVTISEKLWERAFELSYFILLDRFRARDCVARVLEKLAAQRTREKRRVYWRARRRELRIRGISRPTQDILQWLILLESERCEKEQEQQEICTEADMIVRYVKYLAQLTTINSPLDVNVGFNQLLRRYSTREVQQVYELATGRYPGSEEYARAMDRLLKQLAVRFGQFLSVPSAAHGELRFLAPEPQERWSALIDQCLLLFAPWSSQASCLSHGAQGQVGIAEVFRQASSGGATDGRETSRCHWFMHSSCYRQFVEHFGFDLPAERLSVPRFRERLYGREGADPESPERRTDALSEDEIRLLRERVAAVTARPRVIALGPLQIIAHGVVCAQLDSSQDELRQFDIAGDIRLLEVWSATNEGDGILAIHWMDRGEDDAFLAGDYTIGLKGGRQLTLSVTPLPEADAADETGSRAFVTVESHSASTLGERFRYLTSFFERANRVWHPALAAVTLVIVGAIATTVYLSSGLSNEGVVNHHMEMAVVEPKAAIAVLDRDANAPAKSVTHVALGSSVPNLRGRADPGESEVRFAPGEPLVILELPVSNDSHGSYRATLSSLPQDQERLSEAALQPVMRDSGWVIEFALPVSLVEGGTHYVLTLTGGSGAAGGRYTFEVQRE